MKRWFSATPAVTKSLQSFLQSADEPTRSHWEFGIVSGSSFKRPMTLYLPL